MARFDDIVGICSLQWGHRVNAVEWKLAELKKLFEHKLQWGHRVNAVEW